jgi:hypothetical protein
VGWGGEMERVRRRQYEHINIYEMVIMRVI